jgi:hypothetical protein
MVLPLPTRKTDEVTPSDWRTGTRCLHPGIFTISPGRNAASAGWRRVALKPNSSID